VCIAALSHSTRTARSDALSTRFAAQWLHLQDLGKSTPDPTLFPKFDDELGLLAQLDVRHGGNVGEHPGVHGLPGQRLERRRADELQCRRRGQDAHGMPGLGEPPVAGYFGVVQGEDDDAIAAHLPADHSPAPPFGSRSMIVAMPMPPPTHSVAMP
jgi:hypothetical protein